MSTSNIAPITFNGSSTYASSFQQVITRAVSIASLPLDSLQRTATTLQSQQSTLATIGADFNALGSAVRAIGSAAAGTPSAIVSNSAAISAGTSSGVLNGTYSIQVDDVGSSTVTLSAEGLTTVTDPSTQNISPASAFTLTINGAAHTIAPSTNTLQSLASAINTAGDGVHATIVNVGSDVSPDYRLTVTSDSLGADTIQLNDGTADLLDTLSPGTDALYKVNGGSTQIHSTSDQLTLSPGLTVRLLQQTASPVTITVSTNYSALQSSLTNFVAAYNTATDALQQNRGQNGGALTGDSVVYTLGNILSQFSQYTSGSGGVSSLADLGITLDQSGHLSFDPGALAGTDQSQIQQFLGSLSSPGSAGSGFLLSADNALTFANDPIEGIVPTDFASIQQQITTTFNKISDGQSRITDLQNSLQAQLARADAAIATLQSQKTYFAELFTAQYGNGTNSGNNG